MDEAELIKLRARVNAHRELLIELTSWSAPRFTGQSASLILP